jgi:catechol 2,3-dioxygenase-like lactoylglutathione lyase family enzyme
MIEGMDFVVLPVEDMSRALAFYNTILGLKPSHVWEDRWIEYDLDGGTLALMRSSAFGQDFEAVKGGAVGLRVPSVPAAVDMMRAAGIAVPPHTDTAVCQMAFVADSEGNALILHRRHDHAESIPDKHDEIVAIAGAIADANAG